MFHQALISVLLSLAIAAFIKMVIQGKVVAGFSLGGMPSSHTTAVAALFTSVLFEQGWSLLLLTIGVFGTIVVTDAVGVRREVSKHSIMLNKEFKRKDFIRTGHNYLEVLMGVVVGLVVTLIVYKFF